MSWEVHSKSIDLGDGKIITIETGKMARQADGSILLRMGNAALLATVVSAKKPRDGASFFPLSVDYQEKFAGAGRIPGGFMKREGRLAEHEILVSRLVDRALRPLFPDGYMNDTQVIISQVSADENVNCDALAGFAASAALTISDIPFAGPISECRVARINGEFVVNPYIDQMAEADIDILVGATVDDVMMVEGEMHEVSEEDLVEGIKVAHDAIKAQCALQLELAADCGKEKREVELPEVDEDLKARISEMVSAKIYEVASAGLEKHTRKERFGEIKDEMIAVFEEEIEESSDEHPELLDKAKGLFGKIEKKVIREMILNDHLRLDGRKLDEVRDLKIEVDVFHSPHGCSLFCRGETQSLTTTTLGTKQDQKMIDKPAGLSFTNFMLHYNFPPFCTGEAKPMRGTSRREIGHGNLAQRSIKQVLPEDSPYTIRVVSDVLESNGSSSMATVCAASLSLMDAGIPISGGVSGIAMGMISDGEKVAVLSDILGDEDHLGDMDFKVTGTHNGICAVQMDIKVDGLPYEVLTAALKQAKEGRLHILEEMDKVIAEPRPEMKPHAPRIEVMFIDREFIGTIIGPGGKVIQEIQRETETTINIEETEDNRGKVTIFSSNKAAIDAATGRIKGLISQPEVGEVYDAKVKSIMPYGAFVEFIPGRQGLLHISEISWKRIESMDGIFTEGEIIKVKLVGIDERSGKFRLSKKVLEENPNPGQENDRRDRRDNRGGGDRRPPRR